MRKRSLFLVMVLMWGLAACAGWGNKAVGTYELMGTAIKVAHDTVRPPCDAGTLPADKCAVFKGYYQKGRTSYILAGDALSLAIITDNATKRNAIFIEFNDLMAQYLKFTQDALKVGKEMGVIK